MGAFALSFCFLFCCICLLSLEACYFLKENQGGVNLEEWRAVGDERAGKSGVGEETGKDELYERRINFLYKKRKKESDLFD